MQKQILLKAKPRGFHLITEEVMEQLDLDVVSGILHLFIQHSSASLTLNENADPDVRADMERYFLRAIPDNSDYFEHRCEGPDDMPAHIKSSILGSSVVVPVEKGRLALGHWQGIWLGEHRVHAAQRSIFVSVIPIDNSQ